MLESGSWGHSVLQTPALVFLLLDENICCGYSLEAPQGGASSEYPQHILLSRNKTNMDTFWWKKAPHQELCVINCRLYSKSN